MKKENVENIEEPSVPEISQEDFNRAPRILAQALEERPFIKEGLTDAQLSKLSEEQRLREFHEPRISIHYPDNEKKIPCLFLRVTGKEGPVFQLIYYPLEDVALLLAFARRSIEGIRLADWTDDDFERAVDRSAIAMTLLLVDMLSQRLGLMRKSYTFEAIGQWMQLQRTEFANFKTSKALPAEKPNLSLVGDIVKEHAKDLALMWKVQGQSDENEKKILLFREYPGIHNHWKALHQLCRQENVQWKEYARPERFSDTPDDLLNRLEHLDGKVNQKLSYLAIEHAARRVGILKITEKDQTILKNRKKGVNVSGYAEGYLFAFKKEGEELDKRARASVALKTRIATYPIPDRIEKPHGSHPPNSTDDE